MAERETMTLNLSAREMAALNDLATDADLSKTQVLRQALRMYQLVRIRIKNGERMFFSGDEQRAIEFVGLGLDPLVRFPELGPQSQQTPTAATPAEPSPSNTQGAAGPNIQAERGGAG